MVYDFSTLTDVLKMGLRQHNYRGFYDKNHHFLAVFLAYLKYLLYICTTKKQNIMEKEELIRNLGANITMCFLEGCPRADKCVKHLAYKMFGD